MHGLGGMGFGMGWGWIIGLIFLVVLIWFIVRTTSRDQASNQTNNKSALEILKEQYARGEIDKNEFEEKKRILNS
jgi:putative membrane protein